MYVRTKGGVVVRLCHVERRKDTVCRIIGLLRLMRRNLGKSVFVAITVGPAPSITDVTVDEMDLDDFDAVLALNGYLPSFDGSPPEPVPGWSGP